MRSLVLIILGLAGFQTSAYDARLMSGCIDCFNFTAPSVYGSSTVSAPGTGLIIFDTSANAFKGFTGAAWQSFSLPNPSTVSVTSAYTMTAADDTVLASGGSFTVTLPSATVTANQKIYRIEKTDSSLSNVITIGTTSSQTIGGVAGGSYALHTAGETLTVTSDGSNWQIIGHNTNTGWTSPGTITIGATGSAPGKGTTSTDSVSWQRVGSFAYVKWTYQQTTGGSAGSGDYLLSLPSGMSIDTSVVPTYTTTGSTLVTVASAQASKLSTDGQIVVATAYNFNSAVAYAYSSSQVRISTFYYNTGDAVGNFGPVLTLSNTSVAFNITARIPISGWQP